MMQPDIDAVTQALGEIAQTIVLPKFRRLSPEDIEHKASATVPDDVVTVVDLGVEQRLTNVLGAMAPEAGIIGEEAAHADPDLLKSIESDGPLWVIDPIDGTRNFANGDDGFGIMVAWVVEGLARAGWVLLPARGETFVAEAGSGVFLNGVRIRVPHAPPPGLLRGALSTRYMPDAIAAAVTNAAHGRFREARSSGCAAVEYTDILRGERDFSVYYRLLPWDHAAPALILTEGGGRVAHLDGTIYTPRSANQVTIVASSGSISEDVRAWLPRT